MSESYPVEIGRHEVFELEAERGSLLAAGTMIVPDDDIGTAGGERLRAHKAGGSKTEDGDTLAGERGNGRHYLSFRVDRPTRASTKAMIQNRTTTCGSDQPSCSK